MEMGEVWECEYCGCDSIDDLYECQQCGTVFCESHMIDGECPHCCVAVE